MDILNFISWIKKGRYFTSVNPATTLLPIGLKDPNRDDSYLAGTMTVANFAAQVGLPYKLYTAVLTQVAVSAPVATVLQNTLGVVPTYSYSSAGQYIISGITPVLFSTLKVFIVVQGGNVNAISNIVGGGPDAGKIQILNYDTTGALADSGGNPIYLEIRVYN
jgi:hypothetical protein